MKIRNDMTSLDLAEGVAHEATQVFQTERTGKKLLDDHRRPHH